MIKSSCFPGSYLLAAVEHKHCVISAAAGLRTPLCQGSFENSKTKATPAPQLNEITFSGIKDVSPKAPSREESSTFPLASLC